MISIQYGASSRKHYDLLLQSAGTTSYFDPSSLQVVDCDMSDYIVMVRDGQLVMVSADSMRDKIINEYVSTSYPMSAIFVGTNPIYVENTLVEVL